ncbi:MAG: DUF3102 domain-containing protein [Komarekiella atlantica HA4396-MV6]|jgi:hypothetical protein|nr:DUF3102 domain-containing protein [Komarekiella atlantica HA4396-MV6]
MSLSDSTEVIEFYEQPLSKLLQPVLTRETQGFDYSILTSKVQILVQSKTSELKNLIHRSAQDIIDIGQNLTEVKEQLGHGNFRAWLKAEFDWSVRTATRFMQVAAQFKCANLAHLNIAVSALYLLAEPSTPEKARRKALELAKEGENITHPKAKVIVSYYQEQAQPNDLKSATMDISTVATQGNSFTSSKPYQPLQTHSQLELKDEANSVAVVLSVETDLTKKSDKSLEQKTVEKVNFVRREYSEVAAELQPELTNHIRVLDIKHQNLDLVTNTNQTFDLTFVGVRVDFKGSPEALLILFEQMQNNPAFTEEVIQQAKLLAANGLVD